MPLRNSSAVCFVLFWIGASRWSASIFCIGHTPLESPLGGHAESYMLSRAAAQNKLFEENIPHIHNLILERCEL